MDQEKLQSMKAGGHKLAIIRDQLVKFVQPGVTLQQIEGLANRLIDKSDGEAAFKKVPGYSWATCLNLNDIVVHGIPNNTVLKDGDYLSIDIGLYYLGYYTDTTAAVLVGTSTQQLQHFYQTGQKALNAGIKAAKIGRHVSDISRSIQKVIEKEGYHVIHELTGHGVGKKLHEDPYIPNYVQGHRIGGQDHHDSLLYEGQTLAIEPMYTTGNGRIKVDKDGWTIRTADGSLAGQVEHTIALTKQGPIILTK